MTFTSESVRILFHQLPTETQVFYADWEHRLAQRSARLHVDDVICTDAVSEVVIRITENFKVATVTNTDVSGAY